MPGLRQVWPEGAFYSFDEIYGAARLDYRGPEFGWFAVPDQFTLARFDALERRDAAARAAVRVLPDHQHALPVHPDAAVSAGLDAHVRRRIPTTARRSSAPTRSSRTGRTSVPATCRRSPTTTPRSAGYLQRAADRDLVMILLGDHQPAAAVSGEGAPWDVPVHVIASRPQILDALTRRGFRTA